MPTLTWLIELLLVKPTEGSLTDVVITADWRCNGTETTGSGDTEQKVLDWCFANGVDQAAIEANVSLQIENQINPPVVSLPLPWVPPVVDVVAPVVKAVVA